MFQVHPTLWHEVLQGRPFAAN